MSDPRTAAKSWIEGWSRAWPARDAAIVASLYARDAAFYSHPFRPLQPPGEYAAWAFADQLEVEFRFGEPIVDSDRAAVDWWAAITSTDDSIETIAGASLLRFDDEGLVVEQRDVWTGEAGRHELADWAAT